MNHRLLLLSCLAISLVAASCSIALDFTECSSNADCAPLGSNLVCVGNKCQSSATGDTNTGVDGGVDDTHDTGFDGTCTLNSECHANLDANRESPVHVCLEGICTDVTSPDCITLIWPKQGVDNVVFIGSILPLTGPLAALAGTPMEQSFILALEDFNKNGLPGGRKIALLSCDSQFASDPSKAAAEHLHNVLNVPAIIGPLSSTPFIDNANQVTVPAGIFTISPSASAPDVTNIQDKPDPAKPGLAWRVLPSDTFQAAAIVDRIADLGVTTVAVYYKNDAYGSGLFSLISGPLVTALGQDSVKFVSYEDPTTLSPEEANALIAQTAGQMVGQIGNAELVLLLGTGETVPISLAHLNGLIGPPQLWDPDTETPPRFLLSHGGATVLPSFFDKAPPPKVSSLDIFLDFYEATSANIIGPNFLTFNLRFGSRFPGKQIVTASTLSFDAALVTAFAMCTIPAGEEITGTKIAAGIERIIDKNGITINYDGGGYFSTGCNALSQDKNIDLVGVSSHLDFELDTGDIRPTSVIGWGVEYDASKNPPTYLLDQRRLWILDPAPAITGTWTE